MVHAPIFVSHGAPTLAIEDVPATHFLRRLGERIERPHAIVVASAHWETDEPAVNAPKVNETIHDFRGFPEELYRLSYPAPGDPLLAGRITAMLHDHGMRHAWVDEKRGLDHGAWVPLLLAWPEADIPVVQLSVQPNAGPAHHVQLGRIIEPLTREGVQILASGSFTHDLSSWRTAGPDEPEWVSGFADWMDRAIVEGRTEDLINYRAQAPFAERNHPTEEHLLPLFVALGSAGEGARPERIHSSITHGILRMDAYQFTPAALN